MAKTQWLFKNMYIINVLFYLFMLIIQLLLYIVYIN